MTLEMFRIDDRLVHGQVVVGWGQPCALGFLVLVDDAVAQSAWEQDLYRMGVPPEMEIIFDTVVTATARLSEYRADCRTGMLITSDIDTMVRLAAALPDIRNVTVGGVHHKPGRIARARYIYLTPEEALRLQALAACGVTVVAQDVPQGAATPLDVLLRGEGPT